MSRQVVLLSSAEADLRAARVFYASQDARVGDYCLDSLLSDIDRLAFFAGIHIETFGFYRMLASRFPFSIYYRIFGDTVVVAAVLDNRRCAKLGDLLENIGRKVKLTDEEAALFKRTDRHTQTK